MSLYKMQPVHSKTGEKYQFISTMTWKVLNESMRTIKYKDLSF